MMLFTWPEIFHLKFCEHLASKGNQYEFLKHPKIKCLDGVLEPLNNIFFGSGLNFQVGCRDKLYVNSDAHEALG